MTPRPPPPSPGYERRGSIFAAAACVIGLLTVAAFTAWSFLGLVVDLYSLARR